MRKSHVQTPRTDSLGRRLGFERQPTGTLIKPLPNELLTWQWQHRHGDLTLPYIFRYRQLMGFTDAKTSYTTSRRYRNLFHETNTIHKGAYMDWPYQQKHGVDYPNCAHKVHRPSASALKALGEHSMLKENTPHSSSSWWHDFFRTCCTASIELACLEKPDEFRFIHHDTVINNAIAKTGKTPSFHVDDERFMPDAMFGIQYIKTNKVRLFALEADMMTKPIRSKGKNIRDVETTLKLYRQYIKRGLYKKEFAFGGGFFMMMVTVLPKHLENIMKVAADEKFFLFNWAAHFIAEAERKPQPPMPWLFTEPHDRPGQESLYINQI